MFTLNLIPLEWEKIHYQSSLRFLSLPHPNFCHISGAKVLGNRAYLVPGHQFTQVAAEVFTFVLVWPFQVQQ